MAYDGNNNSYLGNFFSGILGALDISRRTTRVLSDYNATPKPKGVLKVDKVYFYAKKNATDHHTTNFDLVHRQPETPIFRRGQTFYLTIRFFERSYDPATDLLRLIFNFGRAPNISQLTKSVVSVNGERDFTNDKMEWDVRVQDQDKETLRIEIQVPPNVPVGIWKCQVLTGDKEIPEKLRLHECPEDIYILFNPWSADDSVYMEEKDDQILLDEFVLADTGMISMGEQNDVNFPWKYGQFFDIVIPVTMYLLEEHSIEDASRNDPILVTRALSNMVNIVVQGKWSDPYVDGVHPTHWSGSVEILSKYLATKQTVKYGQCWVFAGVLTTLCRALGIPARPVTCLGSAHDANQTLSIEEFYHNGRRTNARGDSIWNFHVWVEVWMSRPDLAQGYGGWQAIDGTPQEQSEGVYQCGPASVEAIKQGDIGTRFDVPFVLAEVNADVIMYENNHRSETGYSVFQVDQTRVGSAIYTKVVGDWTMEDIVSNYKFPEGSKEERMSLMNAVRRSEKAKRQYQHIKELRRDVSFQFADVKQISVGESFDVVITVKNNSDQDRTIHANLSVSTVHYTGVKAKELHNVTNDLVLQPQSEDRITLSVSSEEYALKLVTFGGINLHAIATVEETKQTWADQLTFQIRMPVLNIVVSSNPKVGKPIEVTFSFTNPLQIQLTNCKIMYEGLGLASTTREECPTVGPGGTFNKKVSLIPKFAGELNLIGCFQSQEFAHIAGVVIISVSK